MRNNVFWAFSLVATGLATSCGYTTPYQTTGPVLSQDGVQITLAGEQCYVTPYSEQFPIAMNDIDGQLHVGVKLQVRNDSKHVAVLSLDGFRLSGDTQAEHLVMHPQQSGSVSLAPGETKMVPLDFQRQTELDCHHDLSLAAQRAVAIEGRPVYLASIHFQPSR